MQQEGSHHEEHEEHEEGVVISVFMSFMLFMVNSVQSEGPSEFDTVFRAESAQPPPSFDSDALPVTPASARSARDRDSPHSATATNAPRERRPRAR